MESRGPKPAPALRVVTQCPRCKSQGSTILFKSVEGPALPLAEELRLYQKSVGPSLSVICTTNRCGFRYGAMAARLQVFVKGNPLLPGPMTCGEAIKYFEKNSPPVNRPATAKKAEEETTDDEEGKESEVEDDT